MENAKNWNCPFCGCVPEQFFYKKTKRFTIECSNEECAACMTDTSAEAVIKRWSRRIIKNKVKYGEGV